MLKLLFLYLLMQINDVTTVIENDKIVESNLIIEFENFYKNCLTSSVKPMEHIEYRWLLVAELYHTCKELTPILKRPSVFYEVKRSLKQNDEIISSNECQASTKDMINELVDIRKRIKNYTTQKCSSQIADKIHLDAKIKGLKYTHFTNKKVKLFDNPIDREILNEIEKFSVVKIISVFEMKNETWAKIEQSDGANINAGWLNFGDTEALYQETKNEY